MTGKAPVTVKVTKSAWKRMDKAMDKKFGLNKKGQPLKKGK